MKIKKDNVRYWNDRFKNFPLNHSDQNDEISKDFLQKNNKFDLLFDSLVEVGCGTGELSYNLYLKNNNSKILGLDMSKEAVMFANTKYSNNNLVFSQFDCLSDSILEKFGVFDLSISSNTLEHFKDPFKIFENMFFCSKQCIILVPYKQVLEDGYSCEGGAGHVFRFDENTFNNYDVLNYFIFQSNGWQHHSTQGETALQIAYLIKGNIE